MRPGSADVVCTLSSDHPPDSLKVLPNLPAGSNTLNEGLQLLGFHKPVYCIQNALVGRGGGGKDWVYLVQLHPESRDPFSWECLKGLEFLEHLIDLLLEKCALHISTHERKNRDQHTR